MGADLYIEAVHEPIEKKCRPLFQKAVTERNRLGALGDKKGEESAQKRVDRLYKRMFSKGYFRDSYNHSSVLWRMKLSWWKDVGPKCSKKDGNLDIGGVQWLLEQVQSRPLKKLTLEEVQKPSSMDGNRGWDEPKATQKDVDEWNRYFAKRKRALVAFLKQAITLHQPITCSL